MKYSTLLSRAPENWTACAVTFGRIKNSSYGNFVYDDLLKRKQIKSLKYEVRSSV